ncbi:endolysin [Pseudomonas phage vB_Pa-PAC1]
MLDSGDLEYVSGGFMVQDVGHGVVIIKGDLSLRVAEDE